MGSGITYGKRYLTEMIFNLTVFSDDDGNAAGSGWQRVAESAHRVMRTVMPAPKHRLREPAFDERNPPPDYR
jgi:hypothetical protein